MHIGLHIPHSNPEGAALAEGFAALGHRVAWRSAHDYKQGQTEPFDLVVVSGMHGKNDMLVRDYASKGVRALIADFGHFRAVSGYWQLSLDRLGRIPPFACPQDRWGALGLSVAASGGNPKGYVLVAAQRPQDASHGLTEGGYIGWLEAQEGKIRPHPLEGEPGRSLADDLAGARLLKTMCSTAGLEALVAGVPAVAERPDRAVWGELSGESLPSMEDRVALFARIAYAQWTLDEIASGEALRFVMDHWLADKAPDLQVIEPDSQINPVRPRKRRGRKAKT